VSFCAHKHWYYLFFFGTTIVLFLQSWSSWKLQIWRKVQVCTRGRNNRSIIFIIVVVIAIAQQGTAQRKGTQ